MWKQERAAFSKSLVRRLEDANLDRDIVDRMTVYAKRLLCDRNLHRDIDITIAVEELQPNTTEMVDAFIIVASHVARNFGPDNLLAVVSIREWADKNRGPVMV